MVDSPLNSDKQRYSWVFVSSVSQSAATKVYMERHPKQAPLLEMDVATFHWMEVEIQQSVLWHIPKKLVGRIRLVAGWQLSAWSDPKRSAAIPARRWRRMFHCPLVPADIPLLKVDDRH